MRYVSTRGAAPVLGFADVLLAGLATDGGLYVPEAWPTFDEDWWAQRPSHRYEDLAVDVMWPYVEGDLDRITFERLVADAYASFRHRAVVPLRQLAGDRWLLELFHGPTLAFKDVALQLLGRLFDHVLGVRGRRLTIVGATSGDTGSAAMAAVAGLANVDCVILYPYGRVSDVQRRQMTTVAAPNVHAVAVDGTFDDCQDLVKAMFAHEAFRERWQLGAVNSINWARVMAQVPYYAWAALQLGAPGRRVAFSVPTGNFGNVLAGWVATQMGLPLGRLVVGSNTNDILTRWQHTGVMATDGVVPTLSPSMDIQVSSNVERLLFEMNGRDGGLTAGQLARFRSTGRLETEPPELAALQQRFAAARVDDDETLAVIRREHLATGELLDPHTAVGVGAADEVGAAPHEPVVVLATAHRAKFPDAVVRATGCRPALPAHLADLFDRSERTERVGNDLADVEALVARLVGG